MRRRTMLGRVASAFSSCLQYGKRYYCNRLVNLGILAHIDAGKTTLSEDILYNAKEIRVKGNINDQNTQLDFLKQERERGITIKSAYSCFYWNNIKVNLIDTPGHVDFSNETFLSLCVCDRCIIVVDAKEGLQIQTINIFRYIKENLPIFFFFNKMDIYEIDLEYNLMCIKNKLSKKIVLVTYPIFKKKKLKYIIDLPSMILYCYPPVKYGQKIICEKFSLELILNHLNYKNIHKHFSLIESCTYNKEHKNNKETLHVFDKQTSNLLNLVISDLSDILTPEIIDHIVRKREEIVETLCDLDSKIEYKYLNNIKISYEHLRNSLAHGIQQKAIFPVFSGSALNSHGVNLLLDYVTWNAASDTMNKGSGSSDSRDKLLCTVYGTVLFIFKLINEKNGYNTFCKVFKGVLTKNSKLHNVRNNKVEVVKNIYKVKADRYVMTSQLGTNDIGMIRGFEHVMVCDFLCEIVEKENDKCGNFLEKVKIYDNTTSSSKSVYPFDHSQFDSHCNVDHKCNTSQQVDGISFSEIYRIMNEHIENKELWYFLKNYKKRIGKNVIVCTCAIEPKDYRREKELKNIVKNICLEDNSIVAYTHKNNKLVIGSIGILNIEVTLDKIKSDYNIDIKTDDVEIVQKEYILGCYEDTVEKKMKVNSNISRIYIGLCIKEKEFMDMSTYVQNMLRYDNEVEHLEAVGQTQTRMQRVVKNKTNTYSTNGISSDRDITQIYSNPQTNQQMTDIVREDLLKETESDDEIEDYLLNYDYESLFKSNVHVGKTVSLYIEKMKKENKKKKKLYDEILHSCIVSLQNCLRNGYRTNGNIISTDIEITKLEIPDDCTVAVAKYACNDLYYQILRKANVCVANPISLLQIQTHETFVGIIVKDIVQYRNGNIIQITKNKEHSLLTIMNIIALIPVQHTHNYASVLRSISSGHANLSMTFCGYAR
ncbi:tetQ family GTPase, putative [Plasmodium ovale]|uniref:TetQ family GTPase, putative n=2 Tax=Plasmodium ovale TaxID=36330 RepID=A0A1D3UAJ8_PLAOA|nr:tetQ family GTPase, putative [Plasmodium ovale]